jgi:hypothetical protein
MEARVFRIAHGKVIRLISETITHKTFTFWTLPLPQDFLFLFIHDLIRLEAHIYTEFAACSSVVSFGVPCEDHSEEHHAQVLGMYIYMFNKVDNVKRVWQTISLCVHVCEKYIFVLDYSH